MIIETANVTIREEYATGHIGIKPGPYVLLTVTDTGAGMGKETLDHIFEPFFTTKETGKGTGLGLAIVHGIVQQHGGHILCYSEPGLGTTFKIYFPVLMADEQIAETRIRALPQGGSETILLVDDDEFIRELGSTILTKAGYHVITASNGKEALKTYLAHRDEVALVILDLIMPEMGGKQCLEGLLSPQSLRQGGHCQWLLDPLVTPRRTHGIGAKGFVNKPYDIWQMLEVVRSALDEEQGKP